jgi:hypothetical protein
MSISYKKIENRVVVTVDPESVKPDWSINTGFRRFPPEPKVANTETPLLTAPSADVDAFGRPRHQVDVSDRSSANVKRSVEVEK